MTLLEFSNKTPFDFKKTRRITTMWLPRWKNFSNYWFSRFNTIQRTKERGRLADKRVHCRTRSMHYRVTLCRFNAGL